MPALVYVLCFLTSVVCTILLVRAYLRTRTRLLLWSAVCFVFLALNNLFVFTDMILLGPEISILPLRYIAAGAAASVLIYGFIWEVE
jgi:hypothetical protein